MGKNLELALAILNGAVGDYLVRTENGLATEMACFIDGAEVPLDPAGLARTFPAATGRVAVFVHGLMNTEDAWTFPDGTDYGSRLAQDLGYTPLYVRYNSGRPIPDNGVSFSALLATIVAGWPTPITELLPIGYSMGGLVVRSACHVAREQDAPWLAHVRRAIYVGTPHLGAPLERVGRVVAKVLHAVPDPTTRLVAQIADLRSAGLKDLGDADLRHEDRARRASTVSVRDAHHPVPLLPEVRHYLVAGALSADPRIAALFGDFMVPVASATNGAAPERVRIVPGVSHVALAHHPAVYEHIRTWCEEDV